MRGREEGRLRHTVHYLRDACRGGTNGHAGGGNQDLMARLPLSASVWGLVFGNACCVVVVVALCL